MSFRSEGMSRASFESASPKLNEPLLMRRAEEEEEEEEEEEQFQFRSSCETQKSEGEGKRTEEEEAVQPPLLRNMASKEKGGERKKDFLFISSFREKSWKVTEIRFSSLQLPSIFHRGNVQRERLTLRSRKKRHP